MSTAKSVISPPELLSSSLSSWSWKAAGATDRGRVRHANEDALRFNTETGSFIVCDGMGGAQGGATASRLAAESALAVLESSEPGQADLLGAIQTANRHVYTEAHRSRELEGMGTTLVALLLRDGAASIAHVGDSRCYLLRHGRLERLTRDHSFVEEQMRIGRMTREQARRSPMQNVITRAIGTRAEVSPEILDIRLESGDLFLLASDGLTREIEDAVIEKTLKETTDLQTACARLVHLANRAGGRDNISCILVHVVREEEQRERRAAR